MRDTLDPATVDAAAAWQVAAGRRARTPAEVAAWADGDAGRAAAADAVTAGWRMFDDPAAGDAADAVLAQLAEERDRRRRWRRRAGGLAVAASLMLAMLSPWNGQAEAFSTGVGGGRAVRLSDGSRVLLDGDSQVRVRFDGDHRELWLDRGQARFEVARDARPFEVHAGGRNLTTREAAFDVELVRRQAVVTPVRGGVAIASDDLASRALAALSLTGGNAITLTAGQQLVADSAGAAHVAAPDRDAVDAWREGRLVMADMALGDAVARINRQSSRQIVLADPALAQLKLSGVLGSRDAQRFAEIVAMHLPLAVGRSSDGAIVLAPR